MGYSYKLYKNNNGKKEQIKKDRYKENELIKMTTYQLREICIKEKLIKNSLNTLHREELIRLIMKYRGIEESLLIREQDNQGLERLQDFITNVDKTILDQKVIHTPAKLTIYDGVNVEIFDQYMIHSTDGIDEGNVLLVDEEFNICTIFNLIKGNDENYYLVKSQAIEAKESTKKHYSLLYFEKKQSEFIYDIYYQNTKYMPKYIQFYKLPILDFIIKQLVETDLPLAIDFGTTNTTAGIYINKELFDTLDKTNILKKKDQENNIQILEVLDTTSDTLKITPLIPSVVGIKSIDDQQIKYVFSYDAIHLSKSSYVDDGICIFYDIKRWISDFEREEKITDIKGQKTFIKRKYMIKAFLEYIINLSEQRFKYKFKKIHISCPSKQKYRFYTMFKELLTDYELEYENMLDEGAAVLFNTISELIDKKTYEEGRVYKALIIDCGGGTTDLSSCDFRIQNNRVSYEIDIETSYENGDTDFGGNNLTFRIMQLIKIIFANQLLHPQENTKMNILDDFDVDIFRFVDEHGVFEIYKKLDAIYEKVENIIPTHFKDYENKSSEEYFKVKSNFYLLFELAEQIKKVFFHHKKYLEVLITPKEDHLLNPNTILYDKWKIHTYIGEDLEPMKDAPTLTLSMYDVHTLLTADIYHIMKKFLENIYEEDKLLEYSIIKLTGQSCKVDLFREALKEFVPGRIIQSRRNKGKKDCYDLKLICLKGALQYLYAKKFGYINANLKTQIPTLPYVISAYTHSGNEKILIHSLDRENTSGSISRFMERITLKLYLKDANEVIRHEYEYENKPEDFIQTTFEKIEEKYKGMIIQDETDNIVNEEVKFFVWAKKEEWGFCVVPILREDEILFIGKEAFFHFENDTWEQNFFDGLK
ncbi:molecular chaperone [Anaerophilus nitritogenes]|uniref:molecular chaperone n=1 Tax=Anaerophilus nitritogenes TaxID=2498136 RepID=UPI00101C237A|nr:molecular chaperone [Anaerophilus nitritogenes]